MYFNDKPCYITSHMNEKMYALTSWGGTIIVNQPTISAVISTIHDLDRNEAEAAIILTNRVPYYWQVFSEQFELIQAGGGLVRNSNGELLFIHRRGSWDLPKGKLDKGEELPACSIREVQEETGLSKVFITAPLCTTHHTYHQQGKFILKESVWYLMDAPGSQELTAQTEEDISEARWVSQEEISKVLDGSFPLIRDVYRCYKRNFLKSS